MQSNLRSSESTANESSFQQLRLSHFCSDVNVNPLSQNLGRLLQITKYASAQGGALAEWSLALPSGEKINENQKIPGLPPGQGRLLKKLALATIYLQHFGIPNRRISVLRLFQISGEVRLYPS